MTIPKDLSIPWDGQHRIYTSDPAEQDILRKFKYTQLHTGELEGAEVAFVFAPGNAPSSAVPIRRMSYPGKHERYYTTSAIHELELKSHGWKEEAIIGMVDLDARERILTLEDFTDSSGRHFTLKGVFAPDYVPLLIQQIPLPAIGWSGWVPEYPSTYWGTFIKASKLPYSPYGDIVGFVPRTPLTAGPFTALPLLEYISPEPVRYSEDDNWLSRGWHKVFGLSVTPQDPGYVMYRSPRVPRLDESDRER